MQNNAKTGMDLLNDISVNRNKVSLKLHHQLNLNLELSDLMKFILTNNTCKAIYTKLYYAPSLNKNHLSTGIKM